MGVLSSVPPVQSSFGEMGEGEWDCRGQWGEGEMQEQGEVRTILLRAQLLFALL